MDYEDIQTFLMIVETGSISRASDRLFLSQSSVSQRLQHLEDVLGVRLLLRRKGIKNVELTKAGKAFISIARRYTELMNEADALKRERIRPYLSIGATDTLTTNLFLPLMQALVRDYPDTDYKFRVKLSEAIYDDVETGKLDVGLVMDYYKRRDVLVRPVYTEPMVVISRSVAGRCRRGLCSQQRERDPPVVGRGLHPLARRGARPRHPLRVKCQHRLSLNLHAPDRSDLVHRADLGRRGDRPHLSGVHLQDCRESPGEGHLSHHTPPAQVRQRRDVSHLLCPSGRAPRADDRRENRSITAKTSPRIL